MSAKGCGGGGGGGGGGGSGGGYGGSGGYGGGQHPDQCKDVEVNPCTKPIVDQKCKEVTDPCAQVQGGGGGGGGGHGHHGGHGGHGGHGHGGHGGQGQCQSGGGNTKK